MALNRDGDRRGSDRSSGNSSRDGNSGGGKQNNGNTSSGRFLTPPGRMSFQHIFEAEDTDTGPKFNVTLLFPPGTDLRPLKNLLFDALEEKFGKDEKKWPKGLRLPSDVLGDCGDRDYAGYKDGWTYIKFSSKDAPGVVDHERKIVENKREVYNGRWARVSGTAFAYDNKSKGCAFGLNNIQLLQHDDTFSGRPNAEDEFDDKYKDAVEASNSRRSGRDDDNRGRGRDDRDSDRGRGDRDNRDDDRGGRDRDDRSGRDRDGDDRGSRDRGSDRGRGDDRNDRGRDDRDDNRGRSDRGGRDRDAVSDDRDTRGRDDRGSRDREDSRSRDRDEDRGPRDDRGPSEARGGRDSGRDRARDDEGDRGSRGSDRGRDEGRGRGRDDDDRRGPRDEGRDRDRDSDRGGSRGSSRDEGRGSSRSRDDDDRFRD